MITCKKLTAKESKEIGLINEVFKDEDLADETLKFAKALAKKDQGILRKVKTLTDKLFGELLLKGFALEQKLHLR